MKIVNIPKGILRTYGILSKPMQKAALRGPARLRAGRQGAFWGGTLSKFMNSDANLRNSWKSSNSEGNRENLRTCKQTCAKAAQRGPARLRAGSQGAFWGGRLSESMKSDANLRNS